jgi:hypothetical protein
LLTFARFKVPEPFPPDHYPRHIVGSLKKRFDHIYCLYYQLRHLWDVQLKNHRSYWNIRAAHEFWWDYGTRTFEGRRLAWSEQDNWLQLAIVEMKRQLDDLQDEAASRIKDIKTVKKYTLDLLPPRGYASHSQTKVRKDSLVPESPSASTGVGSPVNKRTHPRQVYRLEDDALKGTSPNHAAYSPDEATIVSHGSHDEGGSPHRGYGRRNRERKGMNRRLRPTKLTTTTQQSRRRNNTPENASPIEHVEEVNKPQIREESKSASETSTNGSPTKKRTRNVAEVHEDGRARKSPKQDDTSAIDPPVLGDSDSGDGGCLLGENMA